MPDKDEEAARQIRDKLLDSESNRLARELARSLEGLSEETHQLQRSLIEPTAKLIAFRVSDFNRKMVQLRRRSGLALTTMGVVIAILASSALVDLHVHYAHVMVIEETIGVPITSDDFPMYTPSHLGPPVGRSMLGVGLMLMLVSIISWFELHRKMVRMDRLQNEIVREINEELDDE